MVNPAAAEQTLNAPHDMVVGPHENLTVAVGALTVDVLAPLMEGHELVVVTLGMQPKPGEEMRGYSDACAAYIPAMQLAGVSRVFAVFGAGFLGPEVPLEFPFSDKVPDFIVHIQRDMRRVYDAFLQAELNYTIWCPADYPSGEWSSEYVVAPNVYPEGAPRVTTGKVAHSMVDEVLAGAFPRTRVGIASLPSAE
eukprot:TRINITY_DN45134_c0_g1_i1.p1 TRINITY_DN45134_c0_g1~~TRINITY_DN45134_c0_g1_i1.p1  ORF type:complete len:195 (+),score=35.26 TRINITY_DN45134_c0_g1_i1:288-872(+)